jgi:hypothetical protein
MTPLTRKAVKEQSPATPWSPAKAVSPPSIAASAKTNEARRDEKTMSMSVFRVAEKVLVI